MDQKTMTIKCVRCGKQYLLLEMVMDSSGKGMACRPCAGLAPLGQKAPKLNVHSPATARAMEARAEGRTTTSSIREQFAKPKSPKSSAGKYACLNCRYRFTSSKGPDMLSCPYCGSKRISSPEENSADAILRDSGKRDYDF